INIYKLVVRERRKVVMPLTIPTRPTRYIRAGAALAGCPPIIYNARRVDALDVLRALYIILPAHLRIVQSLVSLKNDAHTLMSILPLIYIGVILQRKLLKGRFD